MKRSTIRKPALRSAASRPISQLQRPLRSTETQAASLRELQTRLLKVETDFINALVDYYYFLLALRAEHDPDARGGPSFDNPDGLAAYLREQLEA